MPAPLWRLRSVRVELEFFAHGTESDGTAVDLITTAIEQIGELTVPENAAAGQATLRIKPPMIQGITVTRR